MSHFVWVRSGGDKGPGGGHLSHTAIPIVVQAEKEPSASQDPQSPRTGGHQLFKEGGEVGDRDERITKAPNSKVPHPTLSL